MTQRRSAWIAALALAGALASPAWSQTVRLSTTQGDILVQLDAAKAPKTVENFLAYVNARHYDGTIFHRVIDGFMIQGGGFTPDMAHKPTRAPIALEARNGLANQRGTLAMARTMEPNSATAQFFINVADNPFLDASNAPDRQGYAVFARVVAGMDVVDKIRAVRTANKGPHQNVPVEPVIIRQATVEK